MNDISVFTIVGLVGVTLVVSVGKWAEMLREWLAGFTFRFNPLRILGNVISCTISVGFVVGCLWSISQVESWSKVFLTGGFVSFVSYVVDEVLALMDAGVRKLMGGGGMPMPPMAVPNKLFGKGKKGSIKREDKSSSFSGEVSNRPLTEEEAHAMVGGKDNGVE